MVFSMLQKPVWLNNLELPWKLCIYSVFGCLRGTLTVSKHSAVRQVLSKLQGHGVIMNSLENSSGLFFFIPKFSCDHCLPIIAKSWESNAKNSLPKIVARSIGKLWICSLDDNRWPGCIILTGEQNRSALRTCVWRICIIEKSQCHERQMSIAARVYTAFAFTITDILFPLCEIVLK